MVASALALSAKFNAFLFETPAKFKTPLGEVLLRKNIITDEQLGHALNLQVKSGRAFGQVCCLGRIIVDQNYASESEIVAAINEHYGLKIHDLSDSIENLITKKRCSLAERLVAPRMTIGAQLFITATLIIVLVTTLFSYLMLERQRDQLYRQTVQLGMVSLNYFNNNAAIPLIENNVLRLNTVIKGATAVNGHLYAMILANDGQIKAHTDHTQIGAVFAGFPAGGQGKQAGSITYFNYLNVAGETVLNLTSPVIFQEKKLGVVHVGLSIDFINELVRKERKIIILMTLVIIVLSGLIATGLGLRFTRPIGFLVNATREISRGNYQHRVDLGRNDELQDLALSFNLMSNQLWLKSLIQDSFGKYVGAQVLDMIIENPECQWVKGRREYATILFADIRGFTAYAETTGPEEVIEGLNEFFQIATQAIHAHGGYVDKFIGDSVMAVFGVPASAKDHIKRAVLAALDMRRKFHELAGAGNPLLAAVGIGINAGPLVAGNIGSLDKMEYTVIGDTVNVASRLNDLAGPGEIIISDSVFDHLADRIDAQTLPLQTIKGKANPIRIHKVLGLQDENGLA